MKQNFLHWDFAEGDKGNASLSVHGGGNFVEQNEFLFIVLTAAKEVQEKKIDQRKDYWTKCKDPRWKISVHYHLDYDKVVKKIFYH